MNHAKLSTIALFTACVLLSGCTGSKFQYHPMKVLWQESTNARLLSAEQIVRVLQECSLTSEEIIEHGPEVRRALAGRGGAKITEQDKIVALIIIQSDGVMILSQERGSFYLPLPDPEPTAAVPPQTLASPEANQ